LGYFVSENLSETFSAVLYNLLTNIYDV
jgi:hypothetical protein